VLALAFSPDGSRLATGCEGGIIKLWETESWNEVASLRSEGWGILSLAFSPDGRSLAVGTSSYVAGNEIQVLTAPRR
jgi:WD40 repeat protein